MAASVHASKLEWTINRLLFKNWPNDAAQTPNYRRAVEGGFKDLDTKTFKLVEEATGQRIGHVAITRKRPVVKEEGKNGEVDWKGKGEKEEKDQGVMEDAKKGIVPEWFNKEVLGAVMKMVRECDVHKDVEYFAITHIYIKPSYRRQGLGSRLMRLAFEKAEKEGVPLIFNTKPAARPFFVSQGFKDFEFSEADLVQWAPPNSGYGMFRLTRMVDDK